MNIQCQQITNIMRFNFNSLLSINLFSFTNTTCTINLPNTSLRYGLN